MPKCFSDRLIMFSVIALVAWAIIGLPILYPIYQSTYQRPAEQTEQNGHSTKQPKANDSTGDKRTTAQNPGISSDKSTPNGNCNCCNCATQPEKGWWEKLWTDPNASFAGAVALFTLGLLIVGAFQVRISQLQYRATVVLEAPNVSVETIKLVEFAGPTDTIPLRDPVPPGEIPQYSRILLYVMNSGRTDANIFETSLNWTVARNLAGYPVYQNVTPSNIVLRASDQLWLAFGQYGDVPWDDFRVFGLEEALHPPSLWVFGYVRYSDSRGVKFKRGFVARWSETQGFVPQPLPEYAYQR